MATVIIGGGIIGTATAFYLSEFVADPSSIHVVESSPTLFAGASGYAGGFLAKDWFSSSSAPLGALSFKLHKELAEKHDGVKKWGYLPSTALSLGIDEDIGVGRGQRVEDWLMQDASRANAAGTGDALNPDGSPAWLTRQNAGSLEVISSDGCAQVDPSKLCHFILSESQKRGVQLHQPATATSISTEQNTKTLKSITITSSKDSTSTTLALKSLVLTAGPWTPTVFSALFPTSRFKIPISSLAGHSLLLRSPRHKAPFTSPSSTIKVNQPTTTAPSTSHAIFCAPSPSSSIPFAPELFSRATGEIYIAGFNSPSKPLPPLATEKPVDDAAISSLKSAAIKLLGSAPQAPYKNDDKAEIEDDLTVEKVGLCWRPVTSAGTPIIGKIPPQKLGEGGIEGDVFVAAGHGPWGISLSLGTGKVVAEMVEGRRELSADVGRLGVR